MAYQLEPLRKALLLPRVNLFIADDVGLGKTIEAGLIVRELLMRQKVRQIVVACPSSVVLQWRDELEARFGLRFMILDRDYIAARRRERGFGVNPWTTHSRFIISHALLRDETYAGPLRDWLGDFSPGSLLILDEAHNAAPASGARYAIDSHFTRGVRDVAHRFEHRLFLSATPHNGHSNSFAALLEILDPQRFCRGVPVKTPALLESVMVRRLKSDLRDVEGGFPERKVVQIDIDGLPGDAPELRLSELLDEYAALREGRFRGASRSARAAAGLIITSLQKRLLSSIEAFASTLAVHRRAIEKQAARPAEQLDLTLLREPPGADDERAELPEDDVRSEEAAQMEDATAATAPEGGPSLARERRLLDQMSAIADAARGRPDERVMRLVAWIGGHPDRRVLVFTEYADTKRWLEEQLRAELADLPDAERRIATFHGGMDDERRQEVKAAFNADPAKHPLRVLIATDAAREGVNFQNHCADLFHFDVPWNPSRMEQRNGRIDRKLQRSPEVRCHYFVFTQRPEDRVIQTLVRKTETIARELGSLSAVLERRLAGHLADGIRRGQADAVARRIEGEELSAGDRATVEEELEAGRERKAALAGQLDQLRDLLELAKRHLRFDETHFRQAISSALELLGAERLAGLPTAAGPARWRFPALDRRHGADPTWADTLDALRAPRARDQRFLDWRRDSPSRPVVFEDPGTLDDEVVHLHLEHRVVRRLLGRFVTQGFVHDDLGRACICRTSDAIPRVLLLARLALHGDGAARLHEEIVAVAARWTDPATRRQPLRPYADEAAERSLDLLDDALEEPHRVPEAVTSNLARGALRDVEELLPHLESRVGMLAARARERLAARGEKEAREMAAILEAQRARIEATLARHEGAQLSLDFSEEERRQLEADRRHWQRRLAALPDEMAREPARIRAGYEVKATQVEPVGLAYLWPVSG